MAWDWTRHDTNMTLLSLAIGMGLYAIDRVVEDYIYPPLKKWRRKWLARVEPLSSLEGFLGAVKNNDQNQHAPAKLDDKLAPRYK